MDRWADRQTERETNRSLINFKPYHAHYARSIKKINSHWFSSLQSEKKVSQKCWQEVEEQLADFVDEVIGTESEARIPHDILCWRITSMTMCQNAKLSPVYGIH